MTGPTWISDGSEIEDPFGYGERAVKFLRLLKHPKSRAPGKPFQLDPWQERIVRRIYGPAHPDGRRKTRVVYLQVGRGNRKTSLGAVLALLHTFGPEKTPGGQVLSAAADRKQARIAYDEALSIVGAVPQLSKVAQPQDFKSRLVHTSSASVYEAIAADAATQYGRTPNFALVDELWAHKNHGLWHAIRTGLTKVAGSLLVITTTAGRGDATPDFPIYDYARKVASGEIVDDAFLPIIFEAPKGSDWLDESIWHTVNPGLEHGYPDLAGLRQLAHEAVNRPADREAFQQFHLGIRLDSSASPFIDSETYDLGAAPIDMEALRDRPCWLGVDLSSSGDLTVIVAAFPDDDGGHTVLPFFFCPGDNLRQRQEQSGAHYVRWAADGLIEATPGNVVDFRRVEAKIRDLCDEFEVRAIAIDPALARNTLNNLTEDGFPAVEHRQGTLSMMPAIAELERALIAGRFRHGGHEVLRWTFMNVEVETNSHGHKTRLSKGKRHASIDGAVAAAMAVNRASAGGGGSIYDSEERTDGLLVI
jgi:phage terminase large subunit-like protein